MPTYDIQRTSYDTWIICITEWHPEALFEINHCVCVCMCVCVCDMHRVGFIFPLHYSITFCSNEKACILISLLKERLLMLPTAELFHD